MVLNSKGHAKQYQVHFSNLLITNETLNPSSSFSDSLNLSSTLVSFSKQTLGNIIEYQDEAFEIIRSTDFLNSDELAE